MTNSLISLNCHLFHVLDHLADLPFIHLILSATWSFFPASMQLCEILCPGKHSGDRLLRKFVSWTLKETSQTGYWESTAEKLQINIAEFALRVQIRTIGKIPRVVSIWFVISVVHLWKALVIARRKNETSINNCMILHLCRPPLIKGKK